MPALCFLKVLVLTRRGGSPHLYQAEPGAHCTFMPSPHLSPTPAEGSCLISIIEQKPWDRGRVRARHGTTRILACSHLHFRASVISPLRRREAESDRKM